MNKILLLSICILTISCKTDPKLTAEENFDWLEGNWQRTNEREGKKTFENWKKISDTEYSGEGFTLMHTDTVFQENIKLLKTDENWTFEVRMKENDTPTVFKLTALKIGTFTCENPENEFPKKIKYEKKGIKLEAVISGGGTEIPFIFERISKK